jgi:uncharacterized protein (DUF1697 family)
MLKRNADIHLALLRGVNLGGKNRLPMKDLALIFAETGCVGVETYIQSGNVVFSAPTRTCEGLAEKVSRQIEKRFGHKPPVVLRSLAQMADVVHNNPYQKPGTDEKSLHVVFLAGTPSAQEVAKLDPNRSPGDEYTVRGQQIYLRLPNGAARSKLTNAYFDSNLHTISTARNWRTTLTLFEMMRRLSSQSSLK